jgi:hypothetical protein
MGSSISYEYGSSPNNKGAINYARNLHVLKELPTIKATLYAERHGTYAFGAILIRTLGPICLIIGLILSGLALKDSIFLTNSFGSQSRLIDAQITPPGVNISDYDNQGGIEDPLQYVFQASEIPAIQQWSIRAGQWGRRFAMTLNLPDALNMPENSLVFVKNTSTSWKNANNAWTTEPTSNQQRLNIRPLSSGNYLNTITLDRYRDDVFIAAKDMDGIQKWYPALLMDGAI